MKQIAFMCGRYAITTPPEAMRVLFGYDERPNFPPRHNVAPTQPVPVVLQRENARHFMLMRWGLIPGWSKQAPTSPQINARAETVDEKPSFRGAFRHRRCLFPADGFYEWRAQGQNKKQAFFIARKDRQPMAFAGIWETWLAADGSEIDTCAILTTAANATLKPVHHRMPVVLEPLAWADWLAPDARPRELLPVLRPASEETLNYWPVSSRVNSIANDSPDLIEPEIRSQTANDDATLHKQQLDLF